MENKPFTEREYENLPTFNYYHLTPEFRAEFLALLRHSASAAILQELAQAFPPPPRTQGLILQAPKSDIEEFLDHVSAERMMDFVEKFIALYQEAWGVKDGASRASEMAGAINNLFEKHNLGYSVIGKDVIRRDSKYFDAKVVRRAYRLLFAAGFEPALAAFERAIEHTNTKREDYRVALHDAEAAVALTLKELLRRYVNSGKHPDLPLAGLIGMAEQLPAFPRAAIEASRAVVNFLENAMKMVHGLPVDINLKPGDRPPVYAVANFALNMAGAYIILLLQLNKSLVATGDLSEWDYFA